MRFLVCRAGLFPKALRNFLLRLRFGPIGTIGFSLLLGLVFGGFGVFANGPVLAQSRIGAATSIKNQVITVRRGQSVRLGQGSSVFQNESISTGKASAARLTFLDETNLSIGPSSRVVLDKFVFSTSRSAQALTINLARGAFRFSTGKFDKRAYKIRTSTTTIGVRGTILDIISRAGRTFVTLVDDGVAFLCLTGTAVCNTLNIHGQTFQIDRFGVRRVTGSTTRYTFNRYCTGNLCKRTKLASRDPGPSRSRPPAIINIVQRPDNTPSHCSSGDCTPEVTGNVSATTGLITGIVHFPGYSATWLAAGLSLPSTTNAPLVNGDTVSGPLAIDNFNGLTVTSTGNFTSVVTVDPGFKYTAWGEWNGNLTVSTNFSEATSGMTSEPVTRGFAVFGNPTSSSVIDAKTGSATYTGPVLGDFAPRDIYGNFGPTVPGAIGGTVTVNANFANRTVSGNFNLTMNGSVWAAPVFSGLPMNTETIVGSNTVFNGPITDPGGTGSGSLEGVFNGPNAEEVAGRFEHLKISGGPTDGGASGIFRGKQGASE